MQLPEFIIGTSYPNDGHYYMIRNANPTLIMVWTNNGDGTYDGKVIQSAGQVNPEEAPALARECGDAFYHWLKEHHFSK